MGNEPEEKGVPTASGSYPTPRRAQRSSVYERAVAIARILSRKILERGSRVSGAFRASVGRGVFRSEITHRR